MIVEVDVEPLAPGGAGFLEATATSSIPIRRCRAAVATIVSWIHA